MIDVGIVLVSALSGAAFWTATGYPLARKLGLQPALGIAPALGWGVHSGVSNVLFRLTGFSFWPVLIATILLLTAALYTIGRGSFSPETARMPVWAIGLAAVVALIPTLAVIPHATPQGIILAAPIFDQAKIAIIDEISRGNLPPLNPFFFETGLSDKLAYYWGWYASAAQLSVLFGASGWEAGIALAWFTAASSLLLMMSLAMWLCGRKSAALFVVLLSFTANLRPFLVHAFGPKVATTLLSPEVGFGTWILNMPWVPQHMAAAVCAILSMLLIPRLGRIASIITLALLVAATIGSSAYIGGFVVPLAAILGGLWILLKSADRRAFVISALAAAALAVALAYPSVMDQAQAVAHRSGPSIAIKNFNPLGPYVPDGARQVLNPFAYWLLMFTIEWPAIYLPGFIALAYGLKRGRLTADRALDAGVLVRLAIAGLLITFLVRSVIGNNDLGWRAVMPAFLVLTVLASAGLASWFRGRGMAAVTLVLVGLSLPNGMEYVRRLVEAYPSTAAAQFAKAPALWEAVRRHAGPDERVINNPLYLHSLTPWPTNISWALLSNRRSCFAVWEMVVVYSPLSHKDSYDTAQVYNRSFAGAPAPDDLEKMANRYRCDVAVVTPFDGAWNNDPFAKTPYYTLAESTVDWRIYRRVK